MWKPALEVAGDYYDFITREDGSIDVLIADVTDKGAPAALYMAHNKSLVRSSLENSGGLISAVKHINDRMLQENVGPFVTCFLARLDPEKGDMSYVNAGHESPLLYRAATEDIVELSSTGLPFGVDPDLEYAQRIVRIEKGDFLVLYPDGLIDAVNDQNQFYGHEALLNSIKRYRNGSAEEIARALLDEVEEYIAHSSPTDDIAIVVVKRH
jgi:sigma-B regulation protein RsbU (phosphoserine phosphatase)